MQGLLVFAVVIATSYAAVTQLNWNDCSTNPNTAITVHSLNLSPMPVAFPGPLAVNLNLTINRQIDHLFIDVELKKKTFTGSLITIPCVKGTNIGTCQNVDACTIMDDILNGTSVVSADLGKQIEAILISALGHQPKCPIVPESVLITAKTLNLQPIPAVLSAIADGNYHLKIIVKDDPTSSENVGCLEFDAGIKRAGHTGFLFN